jgi:hypothetical protein
LHIRVWVGYEREGTQAFLITMVVAVVEAFVNPVFKI